MKDKNGKEILVGMTAEIEGNEYIISKNIHNLESNSLLGTDKDNPQCGIIINENNCNEIEILE